MCIRDSPYVGREMLVRLDRGKGIEDTFFTFTYSPLRDENGRIDRVMAFVNEVTDQVRARHAIEEARRSAEDLTERLHLAIDATELGTWDYHVREDRVVWSRRTYEILGVTPGATVTFQTFTDRIDPADRDDVLAAVEDVMSGRREDLFAEYRVVRGTGTIWARSRGRAVRRSGEVTLLTGTLADITAEKRIEHESNLREIITSNATLPLFMMDARQHCTFMNHAAVEMTGFRMEEVQGRPLHEFIHHTHPDGRPYPIDECPIDRALPTKSRQQGEDVFVRKDGSFYPVAFTASPIVIGGSPIGTVIEVRDLTAETVSYTHLTLPTKRIV